MASKQITIFQQKEELKKQFRKIEEIQQAKRKNLLAAIQIHQQNVGAISTKIKDQQEKIKQQETVIRTISAERQNLKKKIENMISIKTGKEKIYQQQVIKIREIQQKKGMVEDQTRIKQQAQDNQNSIYKKEDEPMEGNTLSHQLQSCKGYLSKLSEEIENVKKQINILLKQVKENVDRQEEQIQKNKKIYQQSDSLGKQSTLMKNKIANNQKQLSELDQIIKTNEQKRKSLLSYLPELLNNETISISSAGLQYLIKNYDPSCPQKNFYWVNDYRVELPIKLKKSGAASAKPYTLIDMWKATVQKYGDNPAITYQTEPDKWRSITYKQYYEDCLNFGKACISLGLSVYSVVMIMGFNSAQWAISFYGSMFARYLPVGMYTTNSIEVCQYIANHSEGELVVVENQMQLAKYYGIVQKCPKLKYFVIFKENVPSNLPVNMKGRVFTWSQFLSLGKQFIAKTKQNEIQHRQNIQQPGNCSTLIYTSGTTGMPKAVMLSHDNYTYIVDQIVSNYVMDRPSLVGKCRILSYLPLSHAAAQIVDLLVPLKLGYNVFYPDASVLQANLLKFLNVAKPNAFLGVPRVWEKIQQKLGQSLSAATGFKKKIIEWALNMGIQGTFSELTNKPLPRGWGIAKKLFFNKLKTQLGFEYCEIFLFGAAPIKETTRKFFLKLNIPLMNNYGMSQSSGPHTFTNMRNWSEYSQQFLKQAGSVLTGGDIGLQNQDKDGKGQICMRGRNIFMGYFKNQTETRAVLDSQGFLHSGDEGALDKNGQLWITGRLKQLIVTAGGENVPPVLIENQITSAIPLVSQAVVIGDLRKYLTVLLCLKLKNQNQLSDQVVQLIKKHGSTAKTLKQAINCPKVREIIQKGLDQSNKKAISNAQRVQKFTILPLQFTIDSGILTPTMKVKRRVVNEMFKAQIEAMYIDSKL